MDKFKSLLSSQGFAEHDQTVHFSQIYPHVYYAFRNSKKAGSFPLWEYVSLVSHNGKFCEAVYEVYINKKNSYNPKGKDEMGKNEKYSKFQKSGQKTIFAMLYRDLAQFEKVLSEIEENIK